MLPQGFKDKLKFYFYSVLTLISPTLNTQVHFLASTGRLADLKNPKTFSEKLSWLKLNVYANDPLVKKCSDKITVRDYVAECGYAQYLNELYAIYENVDEVKWDTLPDSFALKWNFGSGFNYICSNKACVDKDSVLQRMKRWGNCKFWNFHAELQYKDRKKYILCERYLVPEDDARHLTDYKFYCFGGVVKAVLVVSRIEGNAEMAAFMSTDWEYISDIPYRYSHTFYPRRPACLDEMLAAASVLSKPFPFVRVDFYEHDEKPVFGEMTFTPATGVRPSETIVEGKTMGELLEITDIKLKEVGIIGYKAN